MSRITLTEGVTGGFLPAIPRRMIILDLEDDGSVKVAHHVKKDGAGDDEYTVFESAPTISKQEVHTLVTDLLTTFKTLPKENPPMSEDIYKQ
ncbi:hypothetical protein HK102_000781 [Quaeritorhiza haematococci]|nr:hypothetical protein HK102_000781 [Quaeritorhiza haematococci]